MRSSQWMAVGLCAPLFGCTSSAAAPAPEHYTVDVGSAPTKGPANASVVVVEFGDFQCPYCGQEEPIVQQVLTSYGSRILFAFKQFPLTSIHPYAEGAAEASMGANAQGEFWPYHDLLYANQSNLGTTALEGYAAQLGLDTTSFDLGLTNHQFAGPVAADLAQGASLGIDATPTFFVNGVKYVGTISYDTFASVIDQALAAAPPAGPSDAGLSSSDAGEVGDAGGAGDDATADAEAE